MKFISIDYDTDFEVINKALYEKLMVKVHFEKLLQIPICLIKRTGSSIKL